MFSGPEIPMSVLFLALAAIFVLRGPLGKGLADRLAGRAGPGDREVEQLRADLDDVRRQLGEMQERLDFTERLLARERDAGRLAPPRRDRPAVTQASAEVSIQLSRKTAPRRRLRPGRSLSSWIL